MNAIFERALLSGNKIAFSYLTYVGKLSGTAALTGPPGGIRKNSTLKKCGFPNGAGLCS